MPFYTLAIWLYQLLFKAISVFHKKAARRILGLRAQRTEKIVNCDILVHCASAGEYEQVNQVIQHILRQNSKLKIALSFFSPSGIEWIKRKEIDLPYFYLPFDLPKKQKEFIDELSPKAVIVTKNELWFNLFRVLQTRSIPIFIVAASFKRGHFATKIKPFKRVLKRVNHMYLIDEEDKVNLGLEFANTSIDGDPRIDQILSKIEHSKTDINSYRKLSKPIIIYASVHKEDAAIVNQSTKDSSYDHLVVPHEVDKASIAYWVKTLDQNVTLDSAGGTWDGGVRIIDKVGILAKLYAITDYAYVGGGFGKGIHNILEPASFKNIVFIGQNHESFKEARDLVKLKAVHVVSKNDNIASKASLLGSTQKEKSVDILRDYINEQKGSSKRIAKDILSRIK